jgi:beta-N-acetylhexosaminidase
VANEVNFMRLFCLALALLMLCGCGVRSPETTTLPPQTEAPPPPPTTAPTLPPETEPPDPVAQLLDTLSTEEKVGQLFLARCPQENLLEQIQQYRFGGLILFAEDFRNETPETITQTLTACQQQSGIPMLIAVDEEGGTVCRVSEYSAFRESPFPSPRSLYEQGGMEAVLGIEAEKAYLLSSLGINVNMAPVCDITTTPGAFMYRRSLGQDPYTVGSFAMETTQIMGAFGVGAVWKHFPGYGDNADTHTGIAVDNRSLEQLESRDLIPFAMGAISGCDAILVSHTIVTALDKTLPASLSPAVHAYLREEMGFGGVIITDDLVMQAITDAYGAGEAAVLAVLAGNDLLCSTEYTVQYEAVLAAVLEGRIDIDTLNNAVRNVLEWKMELGLISY